jgi:hypothetical protein
VKTGGAGTDGRTPKHWVDGLYEVHDADQECVHGALPVDPFVDCDCFEVAVSEREWVRQQVTSIREALDRHGELIEQIARDLEADKRVRGTKQTLREARRRGRPRKDEAA